MSTVYDFDNPLYLDKGDMREELDRVFDLCHGCRLCWNLCPSFESLFDLIDKKTDGIEPKLSPADQDRVVDECYQCKLCYIKCPYTPPHEWELDFPRLMLRGLAARTNGKAKSVGHKLLAATDATGRLATATSFLANPTLQPNGPVRKVMEKVTGISASRLLPSYAKQRFTVWWKKSGRFEPTTPFQEKVEAENAEGTGRPSFLDVTPEEEAAMPSIAADAPVTTAVPSFLAPSPEELQALAHVSDGKDEGESDGKSVPEPSLAPEVSDPTPLTGRSVAIFATCVIEYQTPDVGKSLVRVLRHNGCDVECATSARCCGMPSLDGGDVQGFLTRARHNVEALYPAVKAGRKIIVSQPTCGYLLKREYPEALKTPEAKEVAAAVTAPEDYLHALRRNGGIREDFTRSLGKVAYHAPCHLRAQEKGYKGRDLLRLVKGTSVSIVEDCAGIDGTWGYRAENVEMAKKIIAPTAEKMRVVEANVLVGECHLANVALTEEGLSHPMHPMQALALAYGLEEDEDHD